MNKEDFKNLKEVDYTLGGVWGNIISFSPKWADQYAEVEKNDNRFEVMGFKLRMNHPKKGQLLVAEFQHSYVIFRFVADVNSQSDPNDMFFGKVEPVEQVEKTENNVSAYEEAKKKFK